MGKKKTNYNLLNPESSSRKYETYVEETIEQYIIKPPGVLESLFKHLISDIEILKSLTTEIPLRSRRAEKPRWKGASGYEHQIDCSFSTEDERVIVLVETKRKGGTINIPEFSTFLVRVIDIATGYPNSAVLGIMVTTQGYQGRDGGRIEDRNCIGKLKAQFNKMGFYITIQTLNDVPPP